MKYWRPSAVRPGGTVDNSPALQCWVTVEQRFNSPGGTTEPVFWRRLNRPSGTFGLIGLRYPAINRWAIVNRPSGTKTDVARRMPFRYGSTAPKTKTARLKRLRVVLRQPLGRLAAVFARFAARRRGECRPECTSAELPFSGSADMPCR